MKDNPGQKWATTDLGDLIDIVMGQAPAGKDCNKTGEGTPFVKTGEFGELRPVIREWTTDPKRLGKATDVFISVVGATCGKINLGADCAIGRSVAALRPKPERLDQFFLHYFMEGQVERLRGGSLGAAQTVISKEMLARTSVPLPPLEEQQRTVAVLDEAFEGLARARAHAEANLKNARELFGSALNEALCSRRSDWRTMAVVDTLTRTKVPAKIQRKAYLEKGAFPIVSQEAELINGYWNNEDDVIHLTRPVVVFGDHTRVLKYVDFDFVVGADGTQIMAPVECLEPRFYYYALKTIDLEGKGYARHFSHLKKCEINFPDSIEAQRSIASQLDHLSANTQHLEEQYIRALQDLDDLRQSLLQKAFAGELT